jgi:hypothetical protein
MVGHQTLDLGIGVRVPVSQPTLRQILERSYDQIGKRLGPGARSVAQLHRAEFVTRVQTSHVWLRGLSLEFFHTDYR